MPSFRVLTAVEQVANCLRDELLRGRWSKEMPGGDRLAEEFQVGRDTMDRALRQLENEGLLRSNGRRRPRLVAIPPITQRSPLRVIYLDYDPIAQAEAHTHELLQLLGQAGHLASIAKKSLTELGMDVGRVAREVLRSEADAWVIGSGSREILEWFAGQPQPAFALFGRMRGLAIAGAKPDKVPAFSAIAQRLVALGHQRIVLMCRSDRRLPEPGETERAFLDTLARHGIRTGPYNLPDWSDHPAGFHECLSSLFQHTPPTALVVDEPALYFAAQQFLGARGKRIPAEVSLVCTDRDPAFTWAHPGVSRVEWKLRPVLRRAVQWATNLSEGKDDTGQTLIPAEFVETGTIGPAPR